MVEFIFILPVCVCASARPHICFAEARVSCRTTNTVELGYKDIG